MARSNTAYRTIQESEQFRLEKARITYGERDADEALQMDVYWPLARDAECGKRSTVPGVWMFFFQPVPGHGYVVYYEFNDTAVVLLSLVQGGEAHQSLYE